MQYIIATIFPPPLASTALNRLACRTPDTFKEFARDWGTAIKGVTLGYLVTCTLLVSTLDIVFWIVVAYPKDR